MLLECSSIAVASFMKWSVCLDFFGQDAIVRQDLMAKSNTVFCNCWFLWSVQPYYGGVHQSSSWWDWPHCPQLPGAWWFEVQIIFDKMKQSSLVGTFTSLHSATQFPCPRRR